MFMALWLLWLFFSPSSMQSTIDECQELIRRVSQQCAPSPTSALDLLLGDTDTTGTTSCRRRHLPTGMPHLDTILRGGFCVGTISELVGRAGVGKSQLALQLCIMAAKFNLASVYIDTEQKLSLTRLKEMAEEKYGSAAAASQLQPESSVQTDNEFSYRDGSSNTVPSLPSATQSDMEGVSDFYGVNETTAFPYKSARDVLANVTIHTATCTNKLLSVVANIEEEVLYRNQQAQEDDCNTTYPVSLLVLDSIAAPTRRDFGSESAPQRVSAVLQLAQMLKRLADQLQLVVVVINQVGLNEAMDDVQSSQGTDLVAVKAALGTAWSHCLSTRLFLEHERDPHRLNSAVDEAHDNVAAANGVEGGDFAWKQERGRVRKATVVKSNVAGNESMFYEIGVDGVNEIRLDAPDT